MPLLPVTCYLLPVTSYSRKSTLLGRSILLRNEFADTANSRTYSFPFFTIFHKILLLPLLFLCRGEPQFLFVFPSA